MKKRRWLKAIIILLILTMIPACNKEREKKDNIIRKKEGAPKSLIAISQELDKVFTSLNEIEETIELSPFELETIRKKERVETDKEDKEDEKEDQKKSKQENKEEDREGEADEKQKENKQGEKEKAAELKDQELFKQWYDIDGKIEKIHKSWNDYEVELTRKTVDSEKVKEFKDNLNGYTIAIENRDIEDIYNLGSRVILSLANFFDLYKDESKGDLSRIKHAAYQANLIGNNDEEKARQLLDSIGEYIVRLRTKLGEDKEDAKRLDKLVLAIDDMKQSLKEKNKRLLEIKRDIIINNIKLLEKEIGGEFIESRSKREVLFAKW